MTDLKLIDFLEANYQHYNVYDIEESYCDFLDETYGEFDICGEILMASDAVRLVRPSKYYDNSYKYRRDNFRELDGKFWGVNDYNCAEDEYKDYSEGS